MLKEKILADAGREKQFKFTPGKLYLRIHETFKGTGDNRTPLVQKSLHFEMPNDQWNTIHIASKNEYSADQHEDATTLENMQPHSEFARERTNPAAGGSTVEHRLATDEEIKSMFQNIDTKASRPLISPQEWLQLIDRVDGLDQEEKERIQRIFDEVASSEGE